MMKKAVSLSGLAPRRRASGTLPGFLLLLLVFFVMQVDASPHPFSSDPAQEAPPKLPKAMDKKAAPPLATHPQKHPPYKALAAPPKLEAATPGPLPSKLQVAPPLRPPGESWPGQAVPWEGSLKIIYGATFSLLGDEPYAVRAEEAYQFVQTEGPQSVVVLGYCVQEAGATPQSTPETLCPFKQFVDREIRLSYDFRLSSNQFRSYGYLHEELTFSAKLVWIYLSIAPDRQEWRLLNLYRGLEDPFTGSNKRMTTIQLPHNTFVTLDRSEKESNAARDIVHFPGQFLWEVLDTNSTVLTRVNPHVIMPLRFVAMQLLSAGVENLIWQWLVTGAGGAALLEGIRRIIKAASSVLRKRK